MTQEELLAFVRNQIALGTGPDAIRSMLAAHGHGAEDANRAIEAVMLERSAPSVPAIASMPPVLPAPALQPIPAPSRSLWARAIPLVNSITLWISLALIGVDTVILIASPGLFLFYLEMVIVAGLFYILAIESENKRLKERFGQSRSGYDVPLLILIVLRNIAVILNSIPFIQVFAALMLGWGSVPGLILYALFMRGRNKATPAPLS